MVDGIFGQSSIHRILGYQDQSVGLGAGFFSCQHIQVSDSIRHVAVLAFVSVNVEVI